jgi:damage-control phosphatase, subfamily I
VSSVRFDDRCYDCLLSRVRFECSLCRAGPEKTEDVTAACGELLGQLRTGTLSHPRIASAMHRRAYELLGSSDPFRELKEQGNREAREVCRTVRGRLHTFRDFVLASVIGNTYDYGVKGHTVTGDFRDYFDREFEAGLAIDHTPEMEKRLDRVVYITDNCGEIVFDRLLIEHLARRGSSITVAVRESPILNDATREEALALHIDRFVQTLTTTGCGCEIGVRLDCMPPDLAQAFRDATLVISKGMANYESLSEYEGLPPVAYLMATKCEPIAEEVGVPRGSKIAMLRV